MIPKSIIQIWIGPLPAPREWMDTWKEKHPHWRYEIFDNNDFISTKFKNKHLMEQYMEWGQYAGVSDLIRYELLYEQGGFLPEADSICLKPIDDLIENVSCATAYENEFVRGSLISPILMAEKNHPFNLELIDELSLLSKDELIDPWKTTGNLFVAKMHKKSSQDITIFPAGYFNPIHLTNVYGNEHKNAYAMQYWGSTKSHYGKGNIFTRLREKRRKKNFKKHLKNVAKNTKPLTT